MSDPHAPAGGPPPVGGLPGARAHHHPALRLLPGTLLLAAAAVLGNISSVSLYFGVEILFGSVASLVAIARLGAVPGLVVAAAGGAYTLALWHHPYALAIFVLEAGAIAWHRHRARCEGLPMPPLAVSAALYWLLLGIPLVLLTYHGPLGMGWMPTVLIAAKQALNGIMNAALAGGLLVGVALLRRQGALPRLDELLFSLLLTALLLPAMIVTAWENRGLKEMLERETVHELRLFGSLAEHSLLPTSAAGPDAPVAELESLNLLAARHLGADYSPRLFLAARDTGKPLVGRAPPAGPIVPGAVPGLALVLPAEPQSSAMMQWRATRYRVALPADYLAPGQDLVIEISTEPIIDKMQMQAAKLMMALLVLALGAVLLARALSRRIVTPLLSVADAARALPTAIPEQREWSAPTPGLFVESVDLGEAVKAMGASLGDSFRALANERDEQMRQRALLDLEAQTLQQLVRHGGDAAAFADQLCQQLRRVLPSHRWVVMLRGAGGHLQAVSSQGLPAPEQAALPELLATPGQETAYREMLATGHAMLPPPLRGGQALPVRGPDGGGLGVLLTDMPHAAGTGFAGEVLEMARTLAELGLASIQLRRQHSVLLDALSQSGTGIVVALRSGADHLVSYVNPAFEVLSGYRAPEILGRDLRILRDGDADQPHLPRLRAALAAAQHCRVVLRNRRPDGSVYWTSLALSPVRGGGAVTHFLGVQQDVTCQHLVENALRESEQRFRTLFETIREGVLCFNADGEVTHANPAAAEILRAPREALIGRSRDPAPWRLLREDGTPLPRDEYPPSIALRTGRHTEPVVLGLADGGSLRRLLVSAHPDKAPGAARPHQVIATFADVTGLQETQQRLKAIFENAPIGIALVGTDRRPIVVNRALTEFLGRSASELAELPFEDFTHPFDREKDVRLFGELTRGERSTYRLTKRYLKPDGTIVFGDLRVALLSSAQGEPAMPLAMVEDVTDLHQARERRRALEETLAAYTARLEELLDLINLSLPASEQVQALLRLARRALAMELGSLEAIAGDGAAPTRIDRSGDLPAATPTLPEALLGAALASPGRPVEGCGEILGPEAAAAGFGSCIALVFTGGGEREDGPERLLLVLWGRRQRLALNDPLRQLLRLTAQRIAAVRTQQRMQLDLVQAKERETIGHLTSGVAHDFNNLLGVVDANLHFIELTMAEACVDEPELGQVLMETRSALSQARVVTSGLLSLSRTDGVPLAAVDLRESISELVGILRHVLPSSVALTSLLPPDLLAWTNSAFLQAALLNLALNARDAMPRGGRLRIAAAPRHWDGGDAPAVGSPAVGDYVEISVSDTGGGIPAQMRPRIFEPLFSTKPAGRGHGLGLFMVKEFVLRSGAALVVESTPGRGSRFRLLLPTSPPPAPPGDAAVSTAAAVVGTDEPPARALAGLRVLVVDDDPRVRDAIGRLLTLAGIETVRAEDGAAALARLREGLDIDLVLADVAMPGLDGPALRERLRTELPSLPVLLMTGHESRPADDDPAADGRAPLRKPVEPAELHAAIRSALAR